MDQKKSDVVKIEEGQIEIPLERVRILIDVIYASAMTIMVLSIDLPDPGLEWTDKAIMQFLAKQADSFWLFLTTLVLIAVYWLKHLEHFAYLKSTCLTHLWLQLIYIGFLVTLPFTHNFDANFPGHIAVQIVYSLNIFFIGAFSCFSWIYATKKHRLVDPNLDFKTIKKIRDEALVEPVVSLVAIAAAFMSADLYRSAFILIPIIFVIQKKWGPRKNNI
jgi:uncharacterized membrane protein